MIVYYSTGDTSHAQLLYNDFASELKTPRQIISYGTEFYVPCSLLNFSSLHTVAYVADENGYRVTKMISEVNLARLLWFKLGYVR